MASLRRCQLSQNFKAVRVSGQTSKGKPLQRQQAMQRSKVGACRAHSVTARPVQPENKVKKEGKIRKGSNR